MLRSARIHFLAPLIVLLSSIMALPLSALQLGGRPADQWAPSLASDQRLARLEMEEVVAAIELQSGDVVADIGAGTGMFSVLMARVVGPTGVILSQEVDAGFLPIIRESAREGGVDNVASILGEFEDPKLSRRDVDVAFIHDVLHHIDERQAYIQALAAYMAPRSRIVVIDYDMNAPGVSHQDAPEMLISPEQVADWMASAGFEVSGEHHLFDNKFFVEYTKVD